MIEIKNIIKKFNGVKILNSVTLTIKESDRVALMGANGAGKTSLIRAILGFYHLDSGEIRVNGFNPTKERVKVLKNISFIPQTPPPIKLTIKELIEFVTKSSNIEEKRIFDICEELELQIKENLSKSFFKLSGGMKQKFLIAIAVAKESKIMIFDEPTANLDPKARSKFYQLMSKVKTNSIYITHRIEEVKGLVDREIYMDLGKIIEDRYI